MAKPKPAAPKPAPEAPLRPTPEHYYHDVPHWFLDMELLYEMADQLSEPAYLDWKELQVSNLLHAHPAQSHIQRGSNTPRLQLLDAAGEWLSPELEALFLGPDAYRWPYVPQVLIGAVRVPCGAEEPSPRYY